MATIEFYKEFGNLGYLANYSNHGFEKNGIYYKTVEHYYQSEKFSDRSIKDKINIRLQDRKEAFESYLPKEVGKIENSVFLTKGNYVILCISNDNTKINELIDSYLK